MSEERNPPVVYDAKDLKVLPMPKTFFELLAAIRERPEMYIGRQSIHDLYVWLSGFRFARMQAATSPLLSCFSRNWKIAPFGLV
jgi:hypothetical protein